MSLPFLVYCSLLKRAQYKDLRDLANVHYGAVDITQVDQAMRDGIEKRLELAEQFLLFSEGLSSETAAKSQIATPYRVLITRFITPSVLC